MDYNGLKQMHVCTQELEGLHVLMFCEACQLLWEHIVVGEADCMRE